MANFDVKSVSKNIPTKYLYIVAALIVVIGAMALYKAPAAYNQTSMPTAQQPSEYVLMSYTPAQLNQDALTGQYYFVGKVKINNTNSVQSTKYAVTFTFRTSNHADITLTQTKYFGPLEVYEFEFQTTQTMLPTETATSNYQIKVG